MMDDWRYRMPAPHLTATITPHHHGLDFGRTMPLRHPPNIPSPPQSYFPFSATHPTLGVSPISVASGHGSRREHINSPSSPPFSSPQSQIPSNESTRAQNAEKKRWQTANYRWMFTKRKGIAKVMQKWLKVFCVTSATLQKTQFNQPRFVTFLIQMSPACVFWSTCLNDS